MRSCLLLLAASALLAADTDKYTLKLKSLPALGKTVTITTVTREEGSSKIYDAADKLLHVQGPIESVGVVHRTMLRAKSSEDWRSLVRYETMQDRDKPAPSYLGRSVIVDCQGGKAMLGVVGKPDLNPADFQKLLTNANKRRNLDPGAMDRSMLPKKPVAVGESWEIEPNEIVTLMELGTLDAGSSSGRGKLIRVYRKNGALWGALEVQLDLKVKSYVGYDFARPLAFDVLLTIESAIDGSSKARIEDGRITIKGSGASARSMRIELDSTIIDRMIVSEEFTDPNYKGEPLVALTGPDNWVPYTSKDGRYSAKFPAKPEIGNKEELKGDTLTATASDHNGNVSYAVYCTIYKDPDPDAKPAEVLEKIAEGFKEGTVKKMSVTLDGLTGIRLIRNMETNGQKMVLTYQAFYVDGRLYQNIVVAAETHKDKAEPLKFFESFKIIKKKEN